MAWGEAYAHPQPYRTILLFLQLEDRADQAVTTTQEHAHEVSKLQVALENSQAELEKIRSKLAAVEEERTAAAKRSRDLLTQWEERDRTQGQDLSVLR